MKDSKVEYFSVKAHLRQELEWEQTFMAMFIPGIKVRICQSHLGTVYK